MAEFVNRNRRSTDEMSEFGIQNRQMAPKGGSFYTSNPRAKPSIYRRAQRGPREPGSARLYRSKLTQFPPQSSRAGLQEVARWQSQTPSNYYYYYQ